MPGYNNVEVGMARPMMQNLGRVPAPQVGQLERGFEVYSQPHVTSAKELFFGDGGKAHYEPRGSDTYKFQPGRRKLYPGKSDYNDGHGGIKKLPIPRPNVLPRAQQRHLPDDQQRSGYDVPERSIELALNRKNRVVRENGSLARDYISQEITLDVSFGDKKKINNPTQQRNGIPVANPGDKLYAAVEYAPGFYKEFNSEYSRVGGRTGTGGKKLDIAPPGEAKKYAEARDTTKAFNKAGMTNTMGRGDTLNFRPRLSYEEKMRIKQLQEAQDEVSELTAGTVTSLNEGGLSWEDRTGLYVWKSKSKREEDEGVEGGGGEEK